MATLGAAGCQLQRSDMNLSKLGRGKKYNILFLSLDDLRPELGCYGVDYVKSPHLDKIAREGVVFTRAYCQQAICNPSRASLLTGRYPDQIQVWDLGTDFRKTKGGENVTTLPQYFKNNKYHTSWTGKIFHPGIPDDISWSEPVSLANNRNMPRHRPWRNYSDATKEKYDKLISDLKEKGNYSWTDLWYPAIESVSGLDDSEWGDAVMADHAIDKLKMYKKTGENFFLAVGMATTHLPFAVPKKYFDLYDPAEIPLAPNPNLPQNAPSMALNTAAFLRAHGDMKAQDLPAPHDGRFPEATARQLKHAYLACVTFMDEQVGRVLDELERLDLKKNTIVCIWGDHGWKLGEHQAWSKMTNFEIDTRCPFIIYHPDIEAKGTKCEALVEFVDIYPTLVDLAGLEIPADLPGKSLSPLLSDPLSDWDNAALSQYFRGGMTPESYDGKNYMGYSIRTDMFRYTEWFKWDNENKKCGKLVAKELYDHRQDDFENENIAEQVQYKTVIEKMARLLKKKLSENKC